MLWRAVLFILLALCTWYATSCKTSAYQEPDWWKTKGETTARVLRYTNYPDFYMVYQYSVDGKNYEGKTTFSGLQGLTDFGARFQVAYNINNPSENKLLYFRYTNANKKMDTTLATITSVYPHYIFENDTVLSISYEYRVDREILVNTYFIESKKLQTGGVQKGDVISVNYSDKNIRISHLNHNFIDKKARLMYAKSASRLDRKIYSFAKALDYNGTIYWLKHPNHLLNDDRKTILEKLYRTDGLTQTIRNVQIIIL